MGHAVYKRLLSRVSKPIDGMLDMHLDRLAYDIVKNIPFDIIQFNKCMFYNIRLYLSLIYQKAV